MIVVVDPDFTNLTHYRQDTQEKRQILQAHIPHLVGLLVGPYQPLLALPREEDSFKFKLACIGEESEWKVISSKAGACYFGHNEFD